jgi:4-hydroxy-2-oxoheptanedioate aldolase
MARMPWNDTIWVQRTLDAGALGLVVPMVNTAEDAKKVVSNMRYSTRGQRSWGGSRVAPYIDGDYRTWTEENLSILVMIETVQAVENVESILSVEGVLGVSLARLTWHCLWRPRKRARAPSTRRLSRKS